MANSLRIRKPDGGGGSLIVGVALVLPLIFLFAILIPRGARLHHPDPRVNFLIHALLIVWPGLVAAWFFRDAPRYYADDEITLRETSFRTGFRFLWWAMLPLLMPLALVLLIFGWEVLLWTQNGAPNWSTSGASAFGTVFIAGAYLLFYGTMFRDRTAVRIGDKGMRTGNLHFLEWENIAQVTRRGEDYRVYHKAAPRLPFSGFTLSDPDAIALLDEHLTRHQVPVTEISGSFLGQVQAVIVIVSLLLLLAGFALYQATRLDTRWVFVLCAVAAVTVTLLLERMRGISGITAQKPVMDE